MPSHDHVNVTVVQNAYSELVKTTPICCRLIVYLCICFIEQLMLLLITSWQRQSSEMKRLLCGISVRCC